MAARRALGTVLGRATLGTTDSFSGRMPKVPSRPSTVWAAGTGQQVGRADEPGDELARRLLVDLARGADLLDAAGVEHGDAVGEGQRLLLVVRDEQEGDADVPLDRLELHLHLLAQLEVEGAERLVEQQHRGAG